MMLRSLPHVSKRQKDSEHSTMILPKKSEYVKVKRSLLLAGRIECCLVYELIDQRNEHKPIMDFHQVFIAVRVSAMPLIKKYSTSAVMFMARKDQFTGRKEEMKRLKEFILREHMSNNEYSFVCDIRGQTLRLKTVFHPGKQAKIEVTLEETDGRVDNGPVLY
jgi:hypothetical protein